MKILFIGDIVARPGRELVADILPGLRREKSIDIVIGNVDNLAHGRGATAGTLEEMQDAGVDFFTGGDHVFHYKDFEDQIEDLPILRAANYPESTPGKGYDLLDLGENGFLLVIALLGRTSFRGTNAYLKDPFRTVDEILEQFSNKDDIFTLIDFHADATSEKNALAFYLDGRAGAVVGTHTHIPTCDARVLPSGTMFVTDVGMTGVIDSVLGVKSQIIIDLFMTGLPKKFEWEKTGTKAFRSVLLDTDSNHIERLDY